MATNDYSKTVNNKLDEILDFVNKLPLNKDQRKKLVKKLVDDSFTIDFDKQYINSRSDDQNPKDLLIEEKKSVDDIIDGIDGDNDSESDAKPLDESDSDHSTDQDTDSENAVENYLSLRSK